MKKNYGIELLRVIAMYFIVIHHIIGQGGAMESLSSNSPQFQIGSIFYVVSCCAVNIYALISGFVLCDKTFCLSRLTNLYFSIIFYTVSIYILLILLGYESLSIGNVIRVVLPISSGHYWYLTSYFGLLLLMPFLNNALAIVQKRDIVVCSILGFIFVCFLPTILRTDPFHTNSGLSTIWLCILYLVGGWLRKSDIISKMKFEWLAVLFVVMVLVTYFSKIFFLYIHDYYLIGEGSGVMFFHYTSPTMVIMAMTLFCLVVKKTFTPLLIKIIGTISPMTLSVYVIHENLMIRKHFFNHFAECFADYNAVLYVCMIVFSAFIIYVSCSAIDYLRIYLFRLMKIKEFSNLIEVNVFDFLNKFER